MVELKRNMDSHSLEIYRGEEHLGYTMWHKDREPNVLLVIPTCEKQGTEQCMDYEYHLACMRNDYHVEVLAPEEEDSPQLCWQKESQLNRVTGVAWRVMNGKQEIGIYDNETMAHDCRNNLNCVVETSHGSF